MLLAVIMACSFCHSKRLEIRNCGSCSAKRQKNFIGSWNTLMKTWRYLSHSQYIKLKNQKLETFRKLFYQYSIFLKARWRKRNIWAHLIVINWCFIANIANIEWKCTNSPTMLKTTIQMITKNYGIKTKKSGSYRLVSG